MRDGLKNWAGNWTFGAVRRVEAGSVEEVCAVVRGEGRGGRVRVLGTGHSFNGIADTEGVQVVLAGRGVVALDEVRRVVTVEAGTRYGELAVYLHERGWAVRNMASLPHIGVAGAVATATHGSGVNHGCLATGVVALEMVHGNGEVRWHSRELDGERFEGMVVALGAMGIVTKLTLEIVPAFELRQWVYEGLAMENLARHFDEVMARGYSVSVFTDWRGAGQVWVKEDLDAPGARDWFGAVPAGAGRHPIPGISAENCTEQMGVAGPWHERLPHFRMEFTPSCGEELQSEYFVARADAGGAIRALTALGDLIGRALLISEIRTIAADRWWLSPFHGRDTVAFHFTWKPEWEEVRLILPRIEGALRAFGVRPHWGKLFTMEAAELRAGYVRMGEFCELARAFDPGGMFRNAFLDRYVFGAG